MWKIIGSYLHNIGKDVIAQSTNDLHKVKNEQISSEMGSRQNGANYMNDYMKARFGNLSPDPSENPSKYSLDQAKVSFKMCLN